MKKQYSFIIPHKNSLLLLKRMLNSIPQRDDVEIIIVDDNSDDNQKPISEDDRVKVVWLDKETSKGAGRARNAGLKEASGKWLLFADADDTYCEGFIDILDKYTDSEKEVVYFFHNLVDPGCTSESRKVGIRDIKKYDEAIIKYHFTVPWNKMIRHDFLDKYNVAFEECPVGNDAFFSFQVGYLAQSYSVELKAIYNYYIHPNSIDHKKKNTADYYLYIFRHLYQYNDFFKFVGHPEWKRTLISKFSAILWKKGFPQFAFSLFVFLKNIREIYCCRKQYTDYFRMFPKSN